MWDLLPSDDESMIAQSVRDFLEQEAPIERLRAAVDPSLAARVRAGMGEIGCLGVGLPEALGGAGLGLVEEMLIQRECGRFLLSPSMLATVLGGHVAAQAGDAALAGALIRGETSAVLAIPAEPAAPGAPAHPVAAYALDWSGSEPLLFWDDEGMGLFDAASFSHAAPEECLDDSVSVHAGSLALANPRLWIDAGQSNLALRAQVLLAASLVGLAGQVCDLAVAYAKVREQFGKPIGTFQAVKHRCADMGLRVRLSWYQTSLACLKVRAAAADAVLQSAAAKLLAAQAAHENAAAAIQLLGGIGFQSECDAHWFMKRAHLYDQAGGAVHAMARRVAGEPSPLW